jgi:hypothetical protein
MLVPHGACGRGFGSRFLSGHANEELVMLKATLLVIVHRDSNTESESSDKIQSKSSNRLFDEGWERTFGKKKSESPNHSLN